MASTLLQGVNAVLKKVESIDSDGELASLTDSSRQVWIDNAVLALNEVVDDLYDLPASPDRPSQVATNTITLATNDQDYALQSDLLRLLPKYGLINRANSHFIIIDDRPDAYRDIIVGDLEQDDTGLPHKAAIRPTDGELWMDRKPTSSENGRVYTYFYEKDLTLSVAADTFPFTEPVFRAVVNTATEVYQRINHREFDPKYYNSMLAKAASRLSKFPRQRSYLEHVQQNMTDPLQA